MANGTEFIYKFARVSHTATVREKVKANSLGRVGAEQSLKGNLDEWKSGQ